MNLIMMSLAPLVFMLWSISISAQSFWQIQEMQGESDDKSTVVTVLLDREMQNQTIRLEEHGTFIQVIIPNTHVLQPGQFIDGNSPLVRKIAAFQVDENTAGLRLFVAEAAARVKPAVSTDMVGQRLMIHIDHGKIAPVVKEEKSPFAGVPSADEVIRRTEVRQGITDPASRTHADAEPLPGTKEVNSFGEVQNKLEWATAGAAVLFLMMTVFIKFRHRLVRNRGDNGEGPAFTMKTLASFPLAPKQRLTLVEVGGQKILLGISPDNINYLTEISDQPSHSKRSQQILEHIGQHKPKITIGNPESISSSASRVVAPRPNTSTDIEEPMRSKQQYSGPKLKDEAFSAQLSQRPLAGQSSVSTRAGANSTSARQKRNPSSSRGQDLNQPTNKASDPTSIEDVTNLIRRKLKDLPKI